MNGKYENAIIFRNSFWNKSSKKINIISKISVSSRYLQKYYIYWSIHNFWVGIFKLFYVGIETIEDYRDPFQTVQERILSTLFLFKNTYQKCKIRTKNPTRDDTIIHKVFCVWRCTVQGLVGEHEGSPRHPTKHDEWTRRSS